MDESLVLELVRRERCRHPRIGCRKLLDLLKADLESAEVKIGRDRFFALLGRADLLIERKPNYARTTNSWHGFRVYSNLARDLSLTGPHQLLVSDITYIRTLEGFMFLSLVMDSFSRAIVGYDSSDSLEMQGALRALSMAQRQLPRSGTIHTMHHSDRGSQYCCGEYITLLESKKMSISMTEQNHCYENSQAERLNGILKQEYGLGEVFKSKLSVPPAVKEAVGLYNEYRPHGALDNRVPMSVHREAAVRGARPPGLRPAGRAPRRITKSKR
jgi:transposase InsO family protein